MTYTLLVGEAYWAEEARTAGDVIAFAMVVVQGPSEPAVRRAARCGVTLPPGFDAWFAQGTAVNPGERFPTATEAVRALRAVEASSSSRGAPIAAQTEGIAASGTTVRLSDPALPDVGMPGRAMTSTGASVVMAAPVTRSRVPLVAAAALVGLGVLGGGTWLGQRPGTARPVASSQLGATAPLVAPAASSAAPVVAVLVVPATSAAGAASAAVGAAKSTRAAGGVKTTSTATVKKPVAPRPDDFTRD